MGRVLTEEHHEGKYSISQVCKRPPGCSPRILVLQTGAKMEKSKCKSQAALFVGMHEPSGQQYVQVLVQQEVSTFWKMHSYITLGRFPPVCKRGCDPAS